MKEWASIIYRDFYDVPRIFIVENEGLAFLFDCEFNREKDEYESNYRVYRMPKLTDEELAGTWEGLSARAEQFLGEVPLSAIEFDPTLRQKVNLYPLRRIISKASGG